MTTIVENDNGEVEVVYETSYNKAPKQGTKSILPDMESIPLGKEIKQEAEKIYIEMDRPTRKDKTRTEMVFACLHFAYAKMNILHSSKELALLVGVDPSNISQIVGKFSLSKVNYHFEQRFYGIGEYIHFLGKKIQLPNSTLNMAIEIGCSLEERVQKIEELQPDLIAGAIIIYTRKRQINQLDYL